MPTPLAGTFNDHSKDPVELRRKFWALVSGEFRDARLLHTGKAERDRLALMRIGVRDLLNTIWTIHEIRTRKEPVSDSPLHQQLCRAGTYLLKYLSRFDREFVEADYDLLPNYKDGVVSFGGHSARCYALLWRELARMHMSLLSDACRTWTWVFPSLGIDGFVDGGCNEAAFAGRFSPADVVAVNKAFNAIPDFNFAVHLRRGNTVMRILFMAANPTTTTPLDLEEELRNLELELRGVKHRDRITFTARHAVRPDDLLRYVRAEQPTVIHFSGHGSTKGIVLRSDDGGEAEVDGRSLSGFLNGRGVELLVLNACYTKDPADHIGGAVNAVIGTTSAVDDEAARRFTVAFYRSLGNGLSIGEAFRDGKDAVSLHGFQDVYWSSGELDRIPLGPSDI